VAGAGFGVGITRTPFFAEDRAAGLCADGIDAFGLVGDDEDIYHSRSPDLVHYDINRLKRQQSSKLINCVFECDVGRGLHNCPVTLAPQSVKVHQNTANLACITKVTFHFD
jgi:hypothetical protein